MAVMMMMMIIMSMTMMEILFYDSSGFIALSFFDQWNSSIYGCLHNFAPIGRILDPNCFCIEQAPCVMASAIEQEPTIGNLICLISIR